MMWPFTKKEEPKECCITVCDMYMDHQPQWDGSALTCRCGLEFVPLYKYPIVVNVELPYIKRSTQYFTTMAHDINSLKEKLKMNRAVFGIGKGDKYWDSAISIIEKHYGLPAEHDRRI